ncbi:MAG: ComF family protein [Bacteroidetes bacterium]|nr:ComF family protein [Bacteroidota bacterium]
MIHSLYPNLCPGCHSIMPNKNMVICTNCELNLPVTNYYQMKDNPVAKLFWGKIIIENAASYLMFNKKGTVQSMMHQMKYFGNKEIGIYLGRKFGKDLFNSEFIEGVEGVIPLPLHPRRLAMRGYNQSEYIAMGLKESLNIPLWNHAVERVVNNISQTKVSTSDRHDNVKDIFGLKKNHELTGKHVLIVDDTITTGATLLSLGSLLQKELNCKISFATIASVV